VPELVLFRDGNLVGRVPDRPVMQGRSRRGDCPSGGFVDGHSGGEVLTVTDENGGDMLVAHVGGYGVEPVR
jgi:hypothetical protein